jgi:hypothetical protein
MALDDTGKMDLLCSEQVNDQLVKTGYQRFIPYSFAILREGCGGSVPPDVVAEVPDRLKINQQREVQMSDERTPMQVGNNHTCPGFLRLE